jgi:hypothetical protein
MVRLVVERNFRWEKIFYQQVGLSDKLRTTSSLPTGTRRGPKDIAGATM